MPSLWVQTVCVYSVRGLLGSDASDWSARRTQHAAAQRERIRLAAGKDRMSHACPIIPLTVTIERTWNLRFYWAAYTSSRQRPPATVPPQNPKGLLRFSSSSCWFWTGRQECLWFNNSCAPLRSHVRAFDCEPEVANPACDCFSTYFPQLSSQLIRKICALLDIRQRLLDYKGNPPGVGWAPAGSFEQRRIVRSQPQ